MPRLSLTWPFIHNTTNNNNTSSSHPSSSSTPLRRKPRTKSRSATGKAPLVSPRESSLYRSAGRRAESPSGGVSDHTATPLHRDAHAHAQPHSSYSSLYHLQDNPSLFFPAPPPRLHLTFDTARHSVVWDDLFDWAESYDLEEDDSPLSGYCRFGYTSQVDLRATSDKRRSVRFAESSSLGLQGLGASGAKSEIWTKSYLNDMSTSPPVIPPRSRLRSQAPPPLTSQSSYLLPVDEPFGDSTTPYTPALSACGSSDRGSPPPMPVSPETETVTFGRRKKSPAGLGKDPLRVRDGTQARRSSSGVYTPPTFPGAQGPRPSHFPSHVYTPPGFLLHPSQPAQTPSTYSYTAAGPSRSASVSSADSDNPATPASSTSRFSTLSGRAGKAMTGLKRISHQIQSNVTPPPIKQPLSARDSYFPSSIDSGVQRVYEPYTPSTRPVSHATAYDPTSPQGLGFGLSESGGRTSGPSTPAAIVMTPETSSRNGTIIFDDSTGEFSSSASAAKTSPQSKGRRKPVPKMLDDQLAQKVDELRLETATSTHAL